MDQMKYITFYLYICTLILINIMNSVEKLLLNLNIKITSLKSILYFYIIRYIETKNGVLWEKILRNEK